jgi:hypothetical protein
VLEQAGEPATGASGNIAGVLRPLPSADDNRLSRLTRAGYLATRALLGRLPGPLGGLRRTAPGARTTPRSAAARRRATGLAA